MSTGDYTLETLAQYLRLSPQQVLKLAEREQVPGRKVGGQWRFSAAEVHHWMERRMGNLEEQELADVEGVLQKLAPVNQQGPVTIGALLPMNAIAVPLPSRTRNSVIEGMVRLAAATGFLWDPPRMVEAIRAREDLHPTALDNGCALLHPRRPLSDILGESFLALGITPGGIPFGGAGGKLTDIFFLICSQDDATHLRVLARLSRLIADPAWLASLRFASDAAEAHDLIVAREATFPE